MNLLIRETSILVERLLPAYAGYGEGSMDLRQDILWRVWRSLKKLEDPSRFPVWLGSIVQKAGDSFLARRYREARVRGPRVGPALENIPVTDGSFFDVAYRELIDQIEELIRILPLRYREVVAMHLFEDLSYSEIAHLTDRPLGTVRSQGARGISILRDRMGGADGL